MYFPTPITILLTTLFALAGLAFVRLFVLRGRSWIARSRDVLHSVMCVAMLAMPWPVSSEPRLLQAQVVLFALAAAYFLVLLILPRITAETVTRIPQRELGCSRIPGYDVLMMTAMVVMSANMLSMSGDHTSHIARNGSMPTMSADSMSAMAPGSVGSSRMTMPMSIPSGRSDLEWIFVSIFAAAAVWIAADALKMRRGRMVVPSIQALAAAAMSAGMALAFVSW